MQYDTVMKYLKHPAVIVICLAALLVLSERTAWHMRMIKALFGGCFAIGATYYMPKPIMQCAWVKKQIKNGFGIYLFHPMIIMCCMSGWDSGIYSRGYCALALLPRHIWHRII